MEEEIWMPIKGYEGRYEVSHFGRVRSSFVRNGIIGRIIRTYDSGIRLSVTLWDGKHSQHKVHHLVLKAFNCDKPDGMECCHNDGDHTNNYIGNLRWDTKASNMQDAIKFGTFNRAFGENSGKAKLKDRDVIKIKELLKRGLYSTEIAKIYNVDNMTIYSIKNGKTWKHIA